MLSYSQVRISTLLQQCSFKQLKQIHAFIITTSLNQDAGISLKFLRRSTEFGKMEYSELLFSQMDEIFDTEILLWNAMIRGYAYNGPHQKCISMYDKMTERGLIPNNFTYPYVLNSCALMGLDKEGKKIHCQILKWGYCRVYSVASSLLNFYLKIECYCDSSEPSDKEDVSLNDTRKVFDEMVLKPIELWNRMISAYANLGNVECAERLFDKMPERDVVSWNSLVTGYAKAGDVEKARDLFYRMPEKNVISWTCMVEAYASSGDLDKAKRLFQQMPVRNVISWNSMISNYNRHGKFKEALDLFVQMHLGGVDMDGFTFVSALSACSQLGALEFGRWIHNNHIEDWSQVGVTVATALIEMYAKCGDVDRAFQVFIKIGNKDVFCWNVMIKSLAIHGRTADAIKIFFVMQKKGVKPNDFTFSSALFACSHGGLVEEGNQIFYSMKRDFGINPKLEHYGCLVDLLCRNGLLEEAELLLKEMPHDPDVAIWGALLGGCRVSSDSKLVERIMNWVDKLKTNEPGVYVLLSNIYASSGQWPEAVRAREKMEEKSLWKKAGCSALEVVHV
ncbi:pentatricopeptide repeat-containing protein At3g29230-like [Telopea speciosissima]|uniref:pentatricopeptide repeat-containing protein At3g29230-like n=1 Tax=Telopea speciosissima TaxID=54955 RepID=UPI001CC41540|nr:pentatricopeptide repeat-containing protein At3g29230-like [Telopea speciosissima]